MKVTVFGIGYVGLVQAAVLAQVGHSVVCVDVDESKIADLRRGIIPIFEPGLQQLVIENHKAGRLTFTTDSVVGVNHSRIHFIAVGTPPDETGAADIRCVLTVAETIAEHISSSAIVVNKSTVPVGTAEKVRQAMLAVLNQKSGKDLTITVVSNPEFLKEGSAVGDCLKPDRIVIGTDSTEAEEVMRELYAPFNRNHEKIMVMDVASAELTKYAANCMLATKISFMNEMAAIAERVGADIEAVRLGIGSDPRIGYHFIYPGAGYGGSCFPKDVRAMIQSAQTVGVNPDILQAVESRNDQQKQLLFEKINNHFNGQLAGKTFALWGLSFKPNTDDMREAPARKLMEALWQVGAKLQAFDPEAMKETQRIYGQRQDLKLCSTKEEALADADALVIVTEWQAFKAPDFDEIYRTLKTPLIFDGRNLYDPLRLKRLGFSYRAIGRPILHANTASLASAQPASHFQSV